MPMTNEILHFTQKMSRNTFETENQPILFQSNQETYSGTDDEENHENSSTSRSKRKHKSIGKNYGSTSPSRRTHTNSTEEKVFDLIGHPQQIKNMEMPDEDNIQRLNSGQESHTIAPTLCEKIMSHLKTVRIHPLVSQLLVYSLFPLLLWVVIFLLVGRDTLPGETVFILVVLECGGRVLGYLVSLLRLPPMVGMLGLGIAVRNIPYLDLMHNWEPAVSAPIRQFALAVILTRAGFGLDLNTLIKFKWLVLRLAVLPTCVESLCVAVLAHFLLDFPWAWGILVGFVVAAVSPAVIVPRILHFKSLGYGEKKGVPTILLAAASLDNVVAISLFGVALGFVFSSNKSTAEMILQCPIEVISGCGFGLVWGLMIAFLFNPSDKIESPNADESVVKGIFILGGGILSIFGFKLVNYSGAGALGCIFAAFVTSCVWKKREFQENEINQIKWGFTFLWQFSEPLLFGVIGLQIIIKDLEGHTVLMSVICLIISAIVRFTVTYGTASLAGLNVKEKLFIAISWIPKATVQAAIGPIALDYASNSESTGAPTLKIFASQVLTIAVVVIMLTAPIGEFAVMFSGPRLLSKDNETVQDDGNVECSK